MPAGIPSSSGTQVHRLTPPRSILDAAYRLGSRRLGLAVTYHGLAERTGDPERDLVPAHGSALFEAQVRYLRAHFRLVSASDLVDAASTRRRGERFPVALTFDDDLRSHSSLAMPILRRLGAPATFFLCGASLDGPHRFWWERLQCAFDRGEGAGVRDIVARHSTGEAPRDASFTIHQLAGLVERLPPNDQDAVSAELEALVGPDPLDAGMRAADVTRLSGTGFEIGFHTLRHRQLPSLDDGELVQAMREGRDRLSSVAARELRAVAYPHGKAGPRVAAAARRAGFDLGFTTRWTAVGPETEPLLLGRVDAPIDSAGKLARRVVRTLLG
jgi:peptidoglycan/xylan/chitin deacetylase (PgdA/CDA1 family)